MPVPALREIKKSFWIGLVIGIPASVLIYLNVGLFAKSSNLAIPYLFAPGVFLLTREVVTGALGIACYGLIQIVWWALLVLVARRLWFAITTADRT